MTATLHITIDSNIVRWNPAEKEWRIAIPPPLNQGGPGRYLACPVGECRASFFGSHETYRGHFALAHILNMGR